jgi:hypothetical protein
MDRKALEQLELARTLDAKVADLALDHDAETTRQIAAIDGAISTTDVMMTDRDAIEEVLLANEAAGNATEAITTKLVGHIQRAGVLNERMRHNAKISKKAIEGLRVVGPRMGESLDRLLSAAAEIAKATDFYGGVVDEMTRRLAESADMLEDLMEVVTNYQLFALYVSQKLGTTTAAVEGLFHLTGMSSLQSLEAVYRDAKSVGGSLMKGRFAETALSIVKGMADAQALAAVWPTTMRLVMSGGANAASALQSAEHLSTALGDLGMNGNTVAEYVATTRFARVSGAVGYGMHGIGMLARALSYAFAGFKWIAAGITWMGESAFNAIGAVASVAYGATGSAADAAWHRASEAQYGRWLENPWAAAALKPTLGLLIVVLFVFVIGALLPVLGGPMAVLAVIWTAFSALMWRYAQRFAVGFFFRALQGAIPCALRKLGIELTSDNALIAETVLAVLKVGADVVLADRLLGDPPPTAGDVQDVAAGATVIGDDGELTIVAPPEAPDARAPGVQFTRSMLKFAEDNSDRFRAFRDKAPSARTAGVIAEIATRSAMQVWALDRASNVATSEKGDDPCSWAWLARATGSAGKSSKRAREDDEGAKRGRKRQRVKTEIAKAFRLIAARTA